MQDERFQDCYASLSLAQDRLVIGNSRIERVFRWNHGHLISLEITDKEGGTTWPLAAIHPDCEFPGEAPPREGSLTAEAFPGNAYLPPHLRVWVTTRLGELFIKRMFRIYPHTPAIGCDYYLKGKPVGSWTARGVPVSELSQLENATAAVEGNMQHVTVERIHTTLPHPRFQSIQFMDVTDRRNNLVIAYPNRLSYRTPQTVTGQLLLVSDTLSARQLFILKEAPCTDVQLAGDGYDFVVHDRDFRAVGLGLHAEEVPREQWIRAYGFATGVATGTEFELLRALRSYQSCLRVYKPGRDNMILQNTWGDRGQDTKLGEAFSLAELEAGSKLGITHFQLDDGWQTGRSSNSAYGGSLDGIWDSDGYWQVNKEKYPNDLTPVIEKARELGIELCLWYNPAKDNSYANWEKDAAQLIELHRKYGIRTFKIDGVLITDKTADRNLRAMLDRVMEATRGEAVFNLDVTAGKRFGYHYFYEYGNKFLENRYTDWGNYYPHWTLRNLWQLSRYVPPSSLQIEFLNKWRNPDRYPADDPLAPANIPFEYCFAVTMMAQPLAWFEGSNLPEEAFSLGPVIREYRKHQVAIHQGCILPIGEEPSGTSWTGFQSITTESEGYIIIYREYNDLPTARFTLWGLHDRALTLEPITGAGQQTHVRTDGEGNATFSLPDRFSYALYRYRC